jgi:imidazolonepropionase-like amidohydrolase
VRRAAVVGCTLAAWTAAGVNAETLVLKGARILPVEAPPIERGVLVVSDGKIATIGREGRVAIPAGATVRDVAGKVVIPGLVDSHSHVADVAGGDRSGALHPDARAIDAVDIRAASVEKARAGGITTVNVMPGSGHLMSGQTAYLKLRAEGDRVEDWLVCSDAEGKICGGLKMANGTNSQRSGPFPKTRGRSAAMVRALFVKAQEYRDKVRAAGDDPAKLPPRDLGLEALVEVLDGKRIVHHHTHRADDILTVVRLSQELGFPVVLHHVSEGYLVADEIAAAGVGAAINVMDSPGGKLENSARRIDVVATLDRAGVQVAIQTDDSVTDSRFLLRSAALAVRGGLSEEKALAAVTLAAARMLGLDRRVGSLAPGKDADFVVLSGSPFSVWTHVEETWVEGRKVFDRAGASRGFQVGGPDLYPAAGAGGDGCLEGVAP